jgi:hypothetical protein
LIIGGIVKIEYHLTLCVSFSDFEKKKGDISPVLEQYLRRIAKTGETL